MNIKRWLFVNLIVLCTACFLGSNAAWAVGGGQAFGAPGSTSVWSYAGKQGIGTSYEQYLDKEYQDNGPTNTISKVWFSLAQGIVTETAYGEIDQAQIKDLQFLVTGNDFKECGNPFFDEEKLCTDSTVDYLDKDNAGRPLSPAYRLVNTDKEDEYTIEKHVFTDPDRQTLFTRVIFTAKENNITPYILVNPHMKNTGSNDVAFVGEDSLNAREGNDAWLSIKSTIPFVKTSAGYVGSSDGYTDLADNGVMDWNYDYTDQNNPGNVAMMAQLPTMSAGQTTTFDIVVGFGESYEAATAQADGSLDEGYASLLAKYNGTGAAVGWEDYLASLSNLPAMIPQTGDNGKQLYASAFVLKTMEDKSNAGALIASLSVPWGDTVNADTFATGYRAVWPRDFYQVAMALLALGDTETPLVAFEFLPQVQVRNNQFGAEGWFLQKTHVDGTLEWVGVQLDQTAMPIMLGWRLWKAGILSDSQISDYYNSMLKPAADFLANGGTVSNGLQGPSNITPPRTQQERWEEQFGYSPSTTSAVITGLFTATDIANAAGDSNSAEHYLSQAKEYQSNVNNYMFTIEGLTNFCDNSGDYFVRITQNDNPNDGNDILPSNGQSAINETYVIDGGFLELVRYGVKPGNDENIAATVCVLDNIEDTAQAPGGGDPDPEDLKIRYEFTFDGKEYPGFRRYGHDGYGERINDGGAYVGGDIQQRGRVWPFFTGERGHYELEKTRATNGGTISDAEVAQLSDIYVRAMEYFANDSFMLPEQVWDGVGSNATYNYTLGEGTDSATPLAWTHAEYIKLVKSLTDKKIWDSYESVIEQYQ